METTQEPNQSSNWADVIIYFFAIVLLPAIIIWGILEYQKNQNSFELAMADKVSNQMAIETEMREKERKSTLWGKVLDFCGKIFTSIISIF